MSTRRFFEALFGEVEQGYFYTWSLKGKNTLSYKCSEKGLNNAIASITNETENRFVGMALSQTELEQSRRVTKDTASGIVAFWCDIDTPCAAHKKAGLPKSEAQIKKFLSFLPAPSMRVKSGNGLHLYWILKEPWIFETPEEKEEAIAAIYLWAKTLTARAADCGFTIDSLSNISQVLRIPGTLNKKPDAPTARCEVEVITQKRYSLDDLSQYMIVDFSEERLIDTKDTKWDYEIHQEASAPQEMLDISIENDSAFERTWKKKNIKLPSQSEHDMSIATILWAHGWAPQFIVNAVIQHRREWGAKARNQRYYYNLLLARASTSILARDTKFQQKKDEESLPVGTPPLASLKEYFGIDFTSIRKYETDPPSYRIDFKYGKKDHHINFKSLADMKSQSKFLDAIMGEINQYVIESKKAKWQKFMKELLPHCVNIDMGSNGSDDGIIASRFISYIQTKEPEYFNKETYGLHCTNPAIYNDEKDLLFVIDDFRTWIHKMYDEKFTNKQIAMVMSVRGAYNQRISISDMKRTFMIVSSHEFDIDLPDKEMVFGEVEE